MGMVRVTPEVHDCIRNAMENPYRFERTERFAMQQVLDGVEVEKVFLDTAQDAMLRLRTPFPTRITTLVRAA